MRSASTLGCQHHSAGPSHALAGQARGEGLGARQPRVLKPLRLPGPYGQKLGDRGVARCSVNESVSLFDLRAKLDVAVKSEDYVTAARLRDTIQERELDTGLAIEDANDRFYRAFQSGRLDEMRRVWGRGEHVQCVHPGGECVAGDDLVIESWGLVLSSVSRGNFVIRLEDVRVYAGEREGFVTCVEVVSSGGDEGRLVATNVFEVQEGRWVLVHHHASPSTSASLMG